LEAKLHLRTYFGGIALTPRTTYHNVAAKEMVSKALPHASDESEKMSETDIAGVGNRNIGS
jgi:hypothetical protein